MRFGKFTLGIKNKATRDSLKVHVISTTIGAFIGAFVAIVGILVQGHITGQQQAATEFRQDRKDVYAQFLDDANAYENATVGFRDCILSIASVPNQVPTSEIIQKEADSNGVITCPEMNQLITARFNFQGSFNKMYIYGSDQALAAAAGLANALPASSEASSTKNGLPPITQITSYKRGQIEKPYDQFLKVMCIDLRPQDTRACDNR